MDNLTGQGDFPFEDIEDIEPLNKIISGVSLCLSYP
jgi:hypothetical protein